MTRLEKKRVLLRAAELVDSDKERTSCLALEHAQWRDDSMLYSTLTKTYKDFFTDSSDEMWLNTLHKELGENYHLADDLRNLRALMLLVFRESL